MENIHSPYRKFCSLILPRASMSQRITSCWHKQAITPAKVSAEQVNGINATQYNKNCRILNMEVGDKVLLSTLHLPIKEKKSRKLSPKYIRPCTLIQKLAFGSAYRLDLPPKKGKLHPIFHVSLLKPYQSSENNKNQKTFHLSYSFNTNQYRAFLQKERIMAKN